jgi:hypothetical protein
MQRQNPMQVQQIIENNMLRRVRFLSLPNLSNQMMLYNARGPRRIPITENRTQKYFNALVSIMKEK